jgi:hypothetical protein
MRSSAGRASSEAKALACDADQRGRAGFAGAAVCKLAGTVAVKLHRCKNLWVKGPHPCWTVQRALDDAGIQYEVVQENWFGGRPPTVEATGQKRFPWIEFEDGSVYREESKDMAARIRAGKLAEAPRRHAAAT